MSARANGSGAEDENYLAGPLDGIPLAFDISGEPTALLQQIVIDADSRVQRNGRHPTGHLDLLLRI